MHRSLRHILLSSSSKIPLTFASLPYCTHPRSIGVCNSINRFRLIFSRSCRKRIMLDKTRSTARLDFTYILQSSSYRQNTCPRLSGSLSRLSGSMLDKSSDSDMPCGVLSVQGDTTPPSRYRLTSLSTRLSSTYRTLRNIDTSWLTRAKNFSRSISTTQRHAASTYRCTLQAPSPIFWERGFKGVRAVLIMPIH